MRFRLLAIGTTAIGAGALLSAAVAAGGPFGWELAVEDAAAPLRLPGVTGLAGVVTQLGSGSVLYPLLALACWYAAPDARRRVRPWLPVLLLAVGQIVESLLLAPLLRVGPVLADQPFLAIGSGHVAAAVLGWGLLATVLATTRFAAPSRRTAVVVPVLVAVTRVLLGVHWSADVLIGAAAGVMLLTAARHLIRCVPEHAAEARFSTVRREPLPVARFLSLSWWRSSPCAWVAPGAATLLVMLMALQGPRVTWFGDLLVYAGSGNTAGLGQDVYAYRTMFGLPFTYPPFAAVLAEPLSRVPWPLLQALWFAATLAAAVLVARIVLRSVVSRLGLPLTVAALLVSAPMRSHLNFGQVGIFLVLLVAADLLGRRRPGVGLGVAIAAKMTPAVFLPWLVVVGDRARLRATLLWAGGCTAVGLLLVWPSAAPYLGDALWDSSRFGANDLKGNQSVRGMLLRAGLEGRAASVAWLAAAGALTVVAVRGARRLELDDNRLGAVAVLVCLSVAVSPISWVHHLVWLVFPVAALVSAGYVRVAVGWWVLLVLSLPNIGAAADRLLPAGHAMWLVVTDAQGLTAVAAILLLPGLLRSRSGSTHGTDETAEWTTSTSGGRAS